MTDKYSIGQEYYRYYAYTTFHCGEELPRVTFVCETYYVVKVNPRSVWLSSRKGGPKERIVYDGAERKYAYPTQEEAWRSFRIRQHRRSGHWRNEGFRIDAILQTMPEEAPTTFRLQAVPVQPKSEWDLA